MKRLLSILLTAIPLFTLHLKAQVQVTDQMSIYEITMKDIHGNDVPFSQYEGKVLLLVNVASECGYTPQYENLEALYQKYKDKGLVVLGFPANNFGEQEPGTNEEILTFCTSKYHVTFPMFSKISVSGDDQHLLYRWLTQQGLNGVMDAEVRWNFHKFLVGPDGTLVQSYHHKVLPDSDEVVGEIEKLLK